jgi:hypothetical protein
MIWAIGHTWIIHTYDQNAIPGERQHFPRDFEGNQLSPSLVSF